MESTAWVVYFIYLLSYLGSALDTLMYVCLFVITIATVACIPFSDRSVISEENAQWYFGFYRNRILKFGIPFVLAIGLISILIPDRTTLYTMVGIHYGEKALTSEQIQQVSDKGIGYLIQKLEHETEQLKENK